MKKTLSILAIIAGIITACDIKAPLKVGYEPPADNIENADSTIYGFCGPATTSRQLQLITSSDDTIFVNVEKAKRLGRVYGGLTPGDEIYVLPDADHSQALFTINKSALLGEWVMPSPYDGSTPSGIVIKDGGEAESFQQQGDIIYKSWSILNGHLMLVETREDGTDLFYTQGYEITRMTSDSLYLRNISPTEDETFEYGRYKPEPEVDLGVDLDYDYEEDYLLF
ncbi:MAG: lipocalin family protein [Prevotella sp.]|nr:lipocalin family protein [Prevotella sp.]